MAITFFAGSGSAPSWRVWLSLEHKEVPYEVKLLSFQKGEHKAPDYLAINPRGKVPAIVDGDFVLYESVAIVEYLDQAYPDSGKRLFPRDPKAAARVRRAIQEVDHYLVEPVRRLGRETLFKPAGDGDPALIEAARSDIRQELERWEANATGDYLAGPLSAADFTLYPWIALGRRVDLKQPENGITPFIGPKLGAWAKRIEALPFYDKTYPPHWRG